MPLDSKSIFELRHIAQSLGVEFNWGDDKPELLEAINEASYQKLKPAEPAPLV